MNPLRKEDWDFTDCPADELWHCAFYEYQRENEELKQGVLKFRADNSLKSFDGSLRWYAKHTRGRKPLFFLTYFPEWPETPYLSIETVERRRRFDALEGGRLASSQPLERIRPTIFFNLLLASKPAPIEKAAAPMGEWLFKELWKGKKSSGWEQIASDVTTHAVFKIYWTLNDTVIVEAFKHWLRQYRPKRLRNRRAGGSTGAAATIRIMKAALKDLGSYRLIRQYGYRGAADFAQKRHRDQSGWTKASKRAEAVIKRHRRVGDDAILE